MSTILSSSISSSYSSTTSSLTSSLGSIVSAAPQQENQRVFTIDPRFVRSRLVHRQI
jgi:hypothetical protein